VSFSNCSRVRELTHPCGTLPFLGGQAPLSVMTGSLIGTFVAGGVALASVAGGAVCVVAGDAACGAGDCCPYAAHASAHDIATTNNVGRNMNWYSSGSTAWGGAGHKIVP